MKMTKRLSIFETTDELSCPVSAVSIPRALHNEAKAKLQNEAKAKAAHDEEEQFQNQLKISGQFLQDQLAKLYNHFASHGETIGIGGDLIYMRSINAVFQQPKAYQYHTPSFAWNGRQSVIAAESELEKILASRRYFDLGEWWAFVSWEYTDYNADRHFHLQNGRIAQCNCGYNGSSTKLWFPVIRLGEETKPALLGEVLRLFWQERIVPEAIDGFDRCYAILDACGSYIRFAGDTVEFDMDSAAADIPESTELTDKAIAYLLNADKRRANFEPYEKALLEEHTQGHWDLACAQTGDRDDWIEVRLTSPVYARNPYRDIQRGSVIGIDFGTKSTIVSLLDAKGDPIPVPVGGRYSAPKASDYENPTVLHLCDFNAFMEQYRSKAGRPETSWQDFTVSHTAKEDLDNTNDKNYYSFITSLKQWAASENEKLELTDDTGERITVPPYVQGGGFDPIEIYAYYIGLAINNMKRSSIYTNYLLSFPVTYKKAVREKIQESFERGLKKSLPDAVAQDEGFLKANFKVVSGTSEPAAYAVCALKQYGFDPKDAGEVHYYGVFDFGGGTTDFDFGLWRGAGEKDAEEDYDYVIEHFGAGGDTFLGGENLLGNLSFTVFAAQENQDILREKRICFTFPRGEQKKFPGYESLISQNSKWANLNMHKMKETLRPFWEKEADYEQKFPDSRIPNLVLFNNDGEQVSDLSLSVDLEALNREIEERVRSGVMNFMHKMTSSMAKYPKLEKINIFLAGNSCKAEIVKKVFEEECGKQEGAFRKKLLEDHNRELEEKLFDIFPPLGTGASFKKMEERGVSFTPDDFHSPTGKTGVAIGLVLSRSGSSILVKNADVDESGEIAFRYVVGKDRRGMLNPVIDFETPLNGPWKQFKRAGSDSLEFYFTGNSSGMTGAFPIEKAKREIRRLQEVPEATPDAYVYIRPVSPTEIEYKVSAGENGDPLFEIERIQFEEDR